MRKKKISASLEDYLEAIYKIIEEKQSVKAIEISIELGVGRSSVSEALKLLAEKKLVNYGRYDAISLTCAGEKVAKKVILKHQVLYDFFCLILGTSPEQAQENACRIEHFISEDALKRLIAFVEFNRKHNEQNPDYLEQFRAFYENPQGVAVN